MCKKAIVLFLIFVFSLAGCQSQVSEAAAASGKASSEGGLRRITCMFARSLECLDDAAVVSAIYLGFFEEEGIEFLMMPSYGSDAPRMVAEGKADMCVPNPTILLTAVKAGVELVSVFPQCPFNVFGVSVPVDSPIKTWKDLEGKKIAANNATTPLTLNPILMSAGVDVSTIEYVVAGTQRPVVLAEGTVDAAYTWYIEWMNWNLMGVKNRYFDGDDVLKTTSNAFSVTPTFYENNKDVLIGIGRAIAKGCYFTECNPLAAAAITAKRYPSLGLTAEEAVKSVELIPKIMKNWDTGRYLEDNMERWQTTLNVLLEMGIIDEFTIDFGTFVKTEFADDINNFDKEAIKKLADEFDINSVRW